MSGDCGAILLRAPAGVTDLWRQPVRDHCGLGWVGHRADSVVPLLVPFGDTRLLQEVLLPGRDDELLQDSALLLTVLPQSPPTHPGAAPAEPGISERGEQVILASSKRPGTRRSWGRP